MEAELLLLPPRAELLMSARFWTQLTDALCERTRGRHESGAFLLGTIKGGKRQVQASIFYDDLHAYDSGIVVLHAGSFGPLWERCTALKLQVVADVHLHPGAAFQSRSDCENPMIAQMGHLAMILPNFARAPVRPEQIGLFEYRGRHRWRNLGHGSITRHLKIGI
jgi:hypothetical protein